MDIINEIILGNDLNLIFFTVLSVIAVYALVAHIKGTRPNFIKSAPNLLTGLGVLGTFTGIFVGLLHFNVQDIDGSVPMLLEGMKTAFFTSIVGMFYGLSIRAITILFPAKNKEENGASSPEEFLNDVKTIRTIFEESSKANAEQMNLMRAAIAGDGDSSVVNQIKLLRTSAADEHKELITEFKNFAKEMAENNSKALIEALEEVMRDFNAKINEQFGENFKQLNQAVGALLEWQENYKEQMQQLHDQYQKCLEGIDQANKAISDIKDNAEAIPQTMKDLKSSVELAQKEVSTLDSQLGAFAEMKDKAVDAFPYIEENIKQLTTGIKEHTEELSETVKSQAETQKTLQDSAKNMTTEVANTAEEFKVKMHESVTSQQDQIRSAIDGMKEGFDKNIGEATTQLSERFKSFDDQMQSELKKAIESMGSQLTSLSNKFVSDYEPLTDKLKSVVQIASRV